MEFGFSEEQIEVQGLARQILTDQVSVDKLAAFDEYASERFDKALWQQLLAAGLPGVAVAQAYGGMGLGFTELTLLVEEVGRTIAPVPVIAHCVSAMLPIQKFAPQAVRDALLPRAASGEILLTAALTEPLNEAAGSPVLTTAEPAADGFVVSGCKFAVPFAAAAHRILLAASVGDDVVVLLVDPQASGVSLEAVQATTFEPQYQLTLDKVNVPAADVVAATGGAAIMAWAELRTAAAVCAHQLGAADAAMRLAASYTSERKQFGVPVATFQAVGHRVADCYIDVECLRLTTYQAVSLLDADVPATTELHIAKIWAGDCGHRVSYATQHVHGGTGIDRDYPLWRYCLWLRYNEMALGSSARHLAALGEQLAVGEALFS